MNKIEKNFTKMLEDFSISLYIKKTSGEENLILSAEQKTAIGKVLRNGTDKDFEKLKTLLN